jgi:hypothetical protein
MRLLKQIFIGIVGMGLVLFFISLLLSSHVRVSKSVLISAPKDSVIQHLLHLQEWRFWNPLLQDSSLSYSFPAGNEAEWQAANGKTNSIRLEHYATDSINAVIATNDQKAFASGFTIKYNTDGTKLTKVEWWISEDISWYPWEKFYGLFSESLKETYLENSLQAFKRYIENDALSQ